MGEFDAARAQLDHFLALDSPKDSTLSAQFVADPRASGLAFLALTLWTLGYPDKAVAAREKAFKLAGDLNHANTSGFVSIYAGAQLSALLGNMDDVRAHVENLFARPEGRMPHWGFLSQIMMGWVLSCAGRLEDGIGLMKTAMDIGENLGGGYGAYGIHWPHYVSLFAILQGRAGNMPESLSAMRKAKDLIAMTGEYFWHADVLRIEGELGLLFGASTEHSEGCFVEALEVARKQQAISFELRAATSMARLWQSQGKRQRAHDLLAPIYGRFTEGFDTLDLKRAKALLDELRECVSTT
jgi:predicted ATPase